MTKRFYISFATLVLAVASNAGIANAAGKVTVKYKSFPTGAVLLDLGTSKGCYTGTAKKDFYGVTTTTPPMLITYQFIFWDVYGEENTDRKLMNFCPGDADTFATAWYLEVGGSGSCPPTPSTCCSAATWAFALDKDEVIPGTTPIASVTPNGPPTAWTSPSTTVLTCVKETIAAQTDIVVAKFSPEKFQYWMELPNTPVSGSSFMATMETAPEVIAFYKPMDRKPIPPCPPPTSPYVYPCK